MSEIDSRSAPSRGRSSVRGGRGGFGRGGPRGGHRQSNGTFKDVEEPSLEDQGEIGELKKQYSSQLPIIKDMFPDWTDVDLVFALQETDGDLQTTIERITEGHITQFSEIKKPKDRARSKAKETSFGEHGASTSVRGTRGRGGLEAGRGGRGRGDRSRGPSRGGRGGAIPTAVRDIQDETAPGTTPETNAWGQAPTTDSATEDAGKKSQWGNVVASESVPKTASEGAKISLLPEGPPKKTWASMFSQPKPAPAPAAPVQAAPAAAAPEPVSLPAEVEDPPVPGTYPEEADAITPALEEEKPEIPQIETPAEATETLEPSHDPLTEDNLEHLPDTSIPPATHTATSTVGSEAAGKITPLVSSQQAPIGRPTIGGYASTAMRATGLTPRSASYQRRVMEQQEAVVLPGHNNVDRAAVQFGSMGLNGDEADADEEREEAETRTQPQQSPPSQPRASLPPAPVQQSQPQDSYTSQEASTPKPAPGLPPVTHQQGQSAQHLAQELDASIPQSTQQSYNQYNRYGQHDVSAPTQKSYDPFSNQTPSAFDQFSSQSQQGQQQGQQQPQQQAQQGQQGQHAGYGGYNSNPSDYSQYYSSEQQRNAYQNYYGGQYGQHQGQGQQDTMATQGRTGSSLGSGQGESAFGSSQNTQQPQSRYNDVQGSGNNTPNPLPGHQSSAPSQQSQQQQQHHNQYGYPYGHPYYNSPYATAYQNQFGYSGYAAPYGKQSGMYGQPHGYGMNAPSSYDHSSSPANSGFNQQSSLQSRDTGLGGGASDYGRSSTQPTSVTGSGFGGISDYGRSQSGYQGQSHGYGSQQGGGSDDLKSYADSKATGPSPGVGQPGRPGSATNTGAGQGQSGLPQSQSHQQQGQQQQQQQQQQGFGGYPGFNQSSQYGSGLGGLGGHQSGGQGGYGGYGGGFGQSYNQYGRGGWGGNYGH